MTEYALEMQNISKTFPGVHALDDVNFSCIVGETHALVGENGAGKSTLIKIIAGVLEPDQGPCIIKVFGQEQSFKNPAQSQMLGISVIYQEFNLLPWLTVAENIYLGRLPSNRFGVVNWRKVLEDARTSLDTLGIELDPRKKVIDLSVAEQQIVEIAKALSMKSRIIIMDEPSAVLAGHELENLFNILQAVKKQGVTVIYISHRLDEVFEIADRATVLKDGKLQGTLEIKEADKSTLIKMMIGRTLDEVFPTSENGVGKSVLTARNLSTGNLLRDVSFDLHKGEILGLAGLVGAGRTELARVLFGIEKLDSGEILIDGKLIRTYDPRRAVDLGIALVPEDRKTQGLVLSISIKKNVALPVLDNLTRWGLIDDRAENKLVNTHMKLLDIKAPSIMQEVQFLSGGNQQKVVLAKWLSTNPKVIILDEPTRGIDVGTKMEMYHIMRRLADQGTGIIMISSELPEIIGMSDRVLVMGNGTIAGELAAEDVTEERILRLAIGE